MPVNFSRRSEYQRVVCGKQNEEKRKRSQSHNLGVTTQKDCQHLSPITATVSVLRIVWLRGLRLHLFRYVLNVRGAVAEANEQPTSSSAT